MILDPLYFILTGPFLLLGLLAQFWVKSAFHAGEKIAAPMTGAEVARRILQQKGLDLPIECIPGELSDHYDPGEKVLRLSEAVYHGQNAAACGVAAHEAGHAIQDAQKYAPLVIRNAAVPMAGIGSGAGIWIFIIGFALSQPYMIWAGVILFSCTVLFQLVNLPVEFNASAKAKACIKDMGEFTTEAQTHIRRTLSAAAMTYVAATIQSIMTLVFLLLRANSSE